MSDYIKREDALDAIQAGKADVDAHPSIFITALAGMNYAAIGVSEVPAADVVEVVRCKNCIWGKPRKDGFGHNAILCHNPDWCDGAYLRHETEFCSDGERKENE